MAVRGLIQSEGKMEIFTTLGSRIADRWAACGHATEAFPEIAAASLDEDPPHLSVSHLDIVRWFPSTPRPVPQINIEASFGQPPITLFRHDRFYIEALFWLESTTSIHQHAFCGAFQVLHGSSIHGEYGFAPAEEVSLRVLLGDLRLREIELLRPGQTRRILPGGEFIHALFHLGHPSVTIVVRTHLSGPLPQYNYLRPNLAWDPFFRPGDTARQMALLRMLQRRDPDSFRSAARALFQRADLCTLVQAGSLLVNAEPDEYERLLEQLSFRPELTTLRPVYEEMRRLANLTQRRDTITDPEHRFFLALLLNVPTQDWILRLVQERFPGQRPVDKVVDWLRQLSRTRVPGNGEPNVLGIATGDDDDIDEGALQVIGLLLQGRPAIDIARTCATLDISAEDVDAFAKQLQATKLLSPLFTT
jgi:hypothetical protein